MKGCVMKVKVKSLQSIQSLLKPEVMQISEQSEKRMFSKTNQKIVQ